MAKYERELYQQILITEMMGAESFRSQVDRLKRLWVSTKSALDSDDDDMGYLVSQSLWVDFLEGGSSLPLPHGTESFAELVHHVCRQFGLVKKGKPAIWAVRYLVNVVSGSEHLNTPSPQLFYQADGRVEFRVLISGAKLLIGMPDRKSGPVQVHDVPAAQQHQFAEWEELADAARKALEAELRRVRDDFERIYPPRRNPSTLGQQTLQVQRMGLMLTGRSTTTVPRNTRSRLSKLIDIDTPSTVRPKNPR